MKFALLALTGLAAAGPVAEMAAENGHRHHHVKVTRFAAPDCKEGSRFGGSETVKNGDCEHYDGGDPGFLSFKAKITYNKKKKLGKDEECRLYAYDKKNCKGKAVPMDDLHTYDGKCQSQGQIFGRSLKLKCMKKTDLAVADDFDETSPKSAGVPGWTGTPTASAIAIVQTMTMPPPGSAIAIGASPIFVDPTTVTDTAPGASLTVVALTVPVPNDPKTLITMVPATTTASSQEFITITTTMAKSDYDALMVIVMATATATVRVTAGGGGN